MLDALSSKIKEAINKLSGKPIIDEKVVKEVIKEIQKGLIMSDVNIRIVFDLSKKIEERSLHEKPPSGITIRENIIRIIYEELTGILGESTPEITIPKGKTTKIMLVGIQGSGKTTTVAKLANYFKELGYRVGIFSTDTYRPAGRVQLKQLAVKMKVEFYDDEKEENSEKLAKKGLEYFNEEVDVLIIDTAGRHKEEKTLLKEMKELEKIIKPDIIFLVIDGSLGQQAYNQAKAFHETTPIGGIIITKLDGTAKGGGALSAATATGARIYFIGTGEKIEDLEFYDPQAFVGRLLGLGDLKGLLKKIESIQLTQERMEKLKQMAKGRFTLIDMIEQLESVTRMGGLYKVLSMIPGFNFKIPRDAVEDLEKKIRKWHYAINSMTDEEKINPSIIKKSRVQRISKGSGVEEKIVKEMLKQYNILRKILKSSRRKKLLKMFGKGLELPSK